MIVHCPKCNREFACDCATAVSSISGSCPLKKKPGAVWVHVMDDEAANVPLMNVSVAGTLQQTNVHGLAVYDPLGAKPDYLVALGDLGGLVTTHSLPDRKEKTVEVKDGNISYVGFELPRLGKLNVEIRASDSSDLILEDGVTVDAKGPTAKNGPAAKGVFGVDPAAKGEYRLTLTLGKPVSDKYALPKVIDPVEVMPGEPKTVPIKLLVRPGPVMKLPDQKVVIVKRAYHGKPKPGVPAHRIPVTLSATTAYDGVGEFTFPAGLQVFDADKPVKSPVTVASGDLTSGKTFHIEADQASAANLGTELKFELKSGSIEPLPAITGKITCVQLELETYECIPKVPSKPAVKDEVGAKLGDDAKVDPGQPVPLQNTDGANKRSKLVLKQAQPADFDGKIVLQPLNGAIELFAEQVPATGQIPVTDLQFDNSALGAGKILWVQGKTVSAAASDTGVFAGVKDVLDDSTGKMAEGDRAVVSVFEVALEMFRGSDVLTIAPFHASDFVAYLDVPLPETDHNTKAPRPPGTEFPAKSNYDDKPAANEDKGVFRWRLKVKPDAIVEPELIDVKVKVLNRDGNVLDKVNGQKTLEGTASHKDGMTAQFKKRADEWESPYARIATIKADASSGDYCVVHSVPPYGSTNLDHGKQLGRKLRVEGSLCGAVFKNEWIMGGKPYAEIPIEFLYVNDGAASISAIKQQGARDKIFNLNQFWAAQGLEFKLLNDLTPMTLKSSPPRTLITISDFTGRDVVSDHPFKVEITTATGGTVTAAIDANWDPSRVARKINEAIFMASSSTLTAVVYDDMKAPRAFLSPVPYPGRKIMDRLGTRGPVDIEINGGGEITELRAYKNDNRDDLDTDIDIYAPSVKRPFHDAAFAPVAANLRHWVRTYGKTGKKHVTVIVQDSRTNERLNSARPPGGYPYATCEDKFCALFDATEATMKGRFVEPMKSLTFESRSAAYTLNMYGMWADPRAFLILFVDDTVFKSAKNDVQHEMGHVLGGLDHPPQLPEWFYENEVVRSGSPPSEVLTHNTNHKIYVGAIEGGEFYWKGLPKGHGGAIRDKIAGDGVMNEWLTNSLEAGQAAW